MKKNVLLTLALSCCLLVQAQTQQGEKPMWGKQDVYLARQTEKTFQLVNDILQQKKNRPSSKAPSLERKAALYLMNAVLHDTRMDGSPVLSQFIEGRYETILQDIATFKKGIREAYWLSYDKLETADRAQCLMTWAECFWYK